MDDKTTKECRGFHRQIPLIKKGISERVKARIVQIHIMGMTDDE